MSRRMWSRIKIHLSSCLQYIIKRVNLPVKKPYMCHKHQSQIERDLKDPHLSDDITVTVDCGFQDWGSLVLGGQGSCLLLYGEESMKVNRVFLDLILEGFLEEEFFCLFVFKSALKGEPWPPCLLSHVHVTLDLILLSGIPFEVCPKHSLS